MGISEFIVRKMGFIPSKGYLHDVAMDGRGIEYAWLFQNLEQDGKVLDVGCNYSYLSTILKDLGYDVEGIDIDFSDKDNENFNFSIQDIKDTRFKSDTFDSIIFLSTLEHIGMYDDSYEYEGKVNNEDFKAIKESIRILKKDGSIFATLPYANKVVDNRDWMCRMYNEKRIEKLFQNFKNVNTKIFSDKKLIMVEARGKKYDKKMF